MDAAKLKGLQAQIKQGFRDDPESAQATLTASGNIDVARINCRLVHETPTDVCGLHPMTGGDGSEACAANMLLQALIGCAGVTFGAVCSAMELSIDAAKVSAEGDLDFRGTLGVSREVPIGFQAIRLHFVIQSSAEDGKLSKAVELAERYCVVAQTLKQVDVSWSRSA